MLVVFVFHRKDHLARRVQCERKQMRQVHDQINLFLLRKLERDGLSGRVVLKFAVCYAYLLFITFFVAFPLSQCLCPLQGLILLQGNQVNELPPNPDEPGKHLFEIAPGRSAFPCTLNISSHSHWWLLMTTELYFTSKHSDTLTRLS